LRISKRQFLVFDKIWFSYFMIKLFYLFFAKTIFSKLTTLGDTFRYLNGRKAWESDWFYSSTVMMDSFAGTFGKILGPYLGSLPFTIISFIGIYYPVSKLNLTKKGLLGFG